MALWSYVEFLRFHINYLELKAVIRAIEHWEQLLGGAYLMVAKDNCTVVAHTWRVCVPLVNCISPCIYWNQLRRLPWTSCYPAVIAFLT